MMGWSLEGSSAVLNNDYIGWIFFSEFLGTMIMIILGNGICAVSKLKPLRTKHINWVGHALGWGFAVFLGALSASYSGAQLNPAVSIAFMIHSLGHGDGGLLSIYGGGHQWLIFIFFAGQFVGAIIGQFIITLFFWIEIKKSDPLSIRGMHYGNPTEDEERQKHFYSFSYIKEIITTTILVLLLGSAMIYMNAPEGVLAFDGKHVIIAAIAGISVCALALCLIGPTHVAMNPVRDWGPRLVYALMPYKDKHMDWKYSWIPAAGPVTGGIIGGSILMLLAL